MRINHAIESCNFIRCFSRDRSVLTCRQTKFESRFEMDIEEWRKRYQEILTAVENASIKTREETEKNDKGVRICYLVNLW